MTEAAPDPGLDERLETRRGVDCDRSHLCEEAPRFAAVCGVDEPIASVIVHRDFPVLTRAAHEPCRPQRLDLQAPAGRARVADAMAAQLSRVLIAAADAAPGCDRHSEVETDLRIEPGWRYSLAPLAPVLAEAPLAALQGRRARRRMS